MIFRKLFQNRNDKDKQVLKDEIIKYYSEGRKEIKVIAYYPGYSKILKEIIKEVGEKQISFNIVEQMKKSKLKIVTENEKDDFVKLRKMVEDLFR